MGSLLPGWDQPSPTSPPPPKFNWSVDRAGKSRSSLDVEVDGRPHDEPDEVRRARSEEIDRSEEIKRRSWDWWGHTPSSFLNDPLRPEPPAETKGKTKRKSSSTYTPQHLAPHDLHVDEPAVGWTFKPAGPDGFEHPKSKGSNPDRPVLQFWRIAPSVQDFLEIKINNCDSILAKKL